MEIDEKRGCEIRNLEKGGSPAFGEIRHVESAIELHSRRDARCFYAKERKRIRVLYRTGLKRTSRNKRPGILSVR